jgi:hypothetical protein
MGKALTLKDVLYGLEFDRQQLCRWPTQAKAPAWSLEPSGAKVAASVADKICMMGITSRVPDTKYGESRFVWKDAV